MKLELLQKIYSDPDYFAGYVTHKIVGNLSLNGTVHAEQNHSSIVRHLGDIMLGSILDHLKSLMERQQQLCNKENEYETDHLIRANHYRPTLDREMGYEELIAVKCLSMTPFKNYFIKQLKSSEALQKSFDDEMGAHIVWPVGVTFNMNDPEHVVIKVGERYKCWRRVDYDIQCKHELEVNFKFNASHWSPR